MKKEIYKISFFIFFLDQIVKLGLLQNFLLGTSIPLIPHFFSMTLVKNTGGAFSILTGNVFLLILIGLAFLSFFVYYIEREKYREKLEIYGLSFILGGLLGNLVDRIFRGGVIDFLDFQLFNYDYPIFNIADIFLVIGVFLLIFEEIRGREK